MEDVLQELYIKASAVRDDAEVREPSAFLYRLAANLLTDRLRSTRRSAMRDGAWRWTYADGEGGDQDSTPSPERAVAARQQLQRLVRALDTLPERTQTIFRRHKFDGLSYEQVAAEVGVSRSSVEKHMMRALGHLAREAQE